MITLKWTLKIICHYVDWIDLALDRKWKVLVNLVINLCFMKGMEFLDELSDRQLHKKNLLHEIYVVKLSSPDVSLHRCNLLHRTYPSCNQGIIYMGIVLEKW